MELTLRKFKSDTKAIFFFSFITLYTAANSQEWQNPAEKYKDAYKKYLSADCPVSKDSIQHFVYFSRDRQSIINHPLLQHPMFKGAQIMYSWKDFEPQKGVYDFSILKEDYEYLKKYGKKIFVQLQDATFDPKYNAVPE